MQIFETAQAEYIPESYLIEQPACQQIGVHDNVLYD
jgi:hypothetical protein